MLEHKEFLDNFCSSDKVERLIEIGFSKEEDDSQSSKVAAISVLNTLIQLYQERKTDNEGEGRRPRGEFAFSSMTKNEDNDINSDGEHLT
jgi:hypothetical protein